MLSMLLMAVLSAGPSFALVSPTMPCKSALTCFMLIDPPVAKLPACTCGPECKCGIEGCEGQNCPAKVAKVTPKVTKPVPVQEVYVEQPAVQYYYVPSGKFFGGRSACSSGNCPN